MKKLSVIISMIVLLSLSIGLFSTQAVFAGTNENTVYYPNGDWEYVPVVINRKVNDVELLNLLIKGVNKPPQCYNEFPSDVICKSVQIRKDIAIIELNSNFQKRIDNNRYSLDIMKDIIAFNVFNHKESILKVILTVNNKTITESTRAEFFNAEVSNEEREIKDSMKDIVAKGKTPDVKIQKVIENLSRMSPKEVKEMSTIYPQQKSSPGTATNTFSASAISPYVVYAPRIYLDPGHGGSDNGASRTYYDRTYYEDEFNLEMAKAAKSYLEYEGYNVYISRTSDVNVSLTSRYTDANNKGAGYFISIHCNSSTNSSANGVETIWPNNHDITASTGLAYAVNRSVYNDTPFAWREPFKDYRNLAVLRSTKMPAIISETGFISNQSDCFYLQGSLNKVGQLIGAGIDNYIGW